MRQVIRSLLAVSRQSVADAPWHREIMRYSGHSSSVIRLPRRSLGEGGSFS